MRNARASAENVKYWKSRIEEHQKSGLSLKEYCRQEGISYWSFNHWKKQIKNKGSKLQEIPPNIMQNLSLGNKKIEVIVDNRVRISIPDGFSEETLKRILSLLGTAK